MSTQPLCVSEQIKIKGDRFMDVMGGYMKRLLFLFFTMSLTYACDESGGYLKNLTDNYSSEVEITIERLDSESVDRVIRVKLPSEVISYEFLGAKLFRESNEHQLGFSIPLRMYMGGDKPEFFFGMDNSLLRNVFINANYRNAEGCTIPLKYEVVSHLVKD